MARYRLTPRGRLGLLEILDYVQRQFGTSVAEKVLVRLEGAFEFLAESPGAGHRRDDLTDVPAIRFWSVGPTLIAYLPGEGGVDILFVERGERDWERLLRQDPL